MFNDQKMKLGLFGTTCWHGLTMSHAPTTYHVTWEHTKEIAQRADALGFEALVPIARWRGFGGTTNFNGNCFETYTSAAWLAEATENMVVGSPEQVVEELGRLNDAGMDGMIMGFLDYNEEMKYFGEHVLPLLKEAGLRH